ncbi:hypothetical protein [Streptomyces silvensis]|uniref:Uncharacterized protein n=1 Tax=Streptomyces silvensis TaxID=1765722 RepID=A0A0W7X3K8_9ACTN|nr:hypothetical protein [Streptomyces silvensis]KUF17368.1 hypothetical protein AT728_16330 [Streptomyces silvensis]
MKLFDLDDGVGSLAGQALREQATKEVDALAAAVGQDPLKLRGRVLELLHLPRLQDADDHDVREVLRELRFSAQEGRGAFRKRLKRVTAVPRPGGIGRLPRPRTVKPSAVEGLCGLCGDPYQAGDLIGRLPTPPYPFVPMGWLCWHCLVQRRQQPQRRDVLLRIFHSLMAGDGVGFNGHECAVLWQWLTETPETASGKAWAADPLESTLTRLQAASREDKPVVWLATQAAHTIVAVLHEAATVERTAAKESEVLRALVQHLAEWNTNPGELKRSAYGTGFRYRQQTVAATAYPTTLSARGGPFYLFHCRITRTGTLVEAE